jgi:hypothetical protein
MELEKRIEILKIKENEFSSKINSIKSGEKGLLPIVDGIINIEKYVKAKYKILWILKEPHDEWVTVKATGQQRNGGWDLVHDIYDKLETDGLKNKKLLVARRISEVAYKLLEETGNPLEAFKSITYINIKKIPGGRFSFQNQIEKAYKDNKILLQDQIETYNPDIIICGNTLPYLSMDNYFVKINRKTFIPNIQSRYCYYALKDRLYINTFHPAYKPTNKIFWTKCVDQIISAVSDWESNFKGKAE